MFPCGGQFRNAILEVELEGGGATHEPPEPALIEGYVREALDLINRRLAAINDESFSESKASEAIEVAAYALWRFNWIHPFAGGNGRTARALTYLVFCIDYGGMVPGKPSMPTIIAGRRREYELALRAADAADLDGREDLHPMRALVGGAIVEQLQQALITAHSELARLQALAKLLP